VDHPKPTERLTFRCWRLNDVAFARALFGDSRVTALVGGPFDDAQIAARLDFELANQRDHGFSYWPVFADDVFVGCCGLKPRGPEMPELGFYFLPAYQGRGYASEAARGVIAHAFDVLGAKALFAGHHPDNVASQRTLEKLGFRYTHHELYPPTGREHPGYELRP
jgi:RimJ/RimL family protein N-acetyltransferase